MRKVWRKYLGYGIYAEIEIDFEKPEIIFRPDPNLPLDIPKSDMEPIEKHRDLIREMAAGVANITGESFEIAIPEIMGYPAQTITARPRRRFFSVAPIRWNH